MLVVVVVVVVERVSCIPGIGTAAAAGAGAFLTMTFEATKLSPSFS